MPKLPVRRRDKSIRCWVRISRQDVWWAKECSWHMTGAYPARSEYLGNRKSRDRHLHRDVMGLEPGDGREVDHIDGDPLNALRSNLRIVTSSQNKQNRHKPYSRRKYKLARGVTYCKANKRYYAICTVRYKRVYLGCFTCKRKAAKAATEGRRKHGFLTDKRG